MGQSSISIPLVLATVVALGAIIALAIVGWLFLANLNDRTQANNDVEVLDAGLAVARSASSVAATGAVESNGTMTRDSVIAARAAIAEDKAELSNQLALLEGKGYDVRVGFIKEQVDLLTATIDQIENGRPDLLRAMLAGEQNRQRLTKTTSRELSPALVTSIDNQLYFMLTGRSENRRGGATGAEAFSREEFMRFAHLNTLSQSIGIGHSSLIAASSMRDPTLVTNVEEAFDTSSQRAEKSIAYLAEVGGAELDPRVLPLSTALFEAGTGDGNYFSALKVRLAMAVRERQLIAETDQILAGLQAEIDALVDDVQQTSTARKDDSDQTASAGRMVMLIIGIVGVVIVVLGTGIAMFRRQGA